MKTKPPLGALDFTQIELAKSRERLIDQEEHLERRKNANSRKQEELKQKEEDLAAVGGGCVGAAVWDGGGSKM